MKRLFTLLLLSAGITLYGQDRPLHDFGFAIGAISSMDLSDKTEDVLDGGIPRAGDSLSFSAFALPTVTATYKIRGTDRLMFRFDISWQLINEDVLLNEIKVGDKSTNFLSFGLGVDYYYFEKGRLELYSGATIAPTLQYARLSNVEGIDDESTADGFFNYQINAVGLRYGDDLAVILELGYGYKGIGSLGISFRY